MFPLYPLCFSKIHVSIYLFYLFYFFFSIRVSSMPQIFESSLSMLQPFKLLRWHQCLLKLCVCVCVCVCVCACVCACVYMYHCFMFAWTVHRNFCRNSYMKYMSNSNCKTKYSGYYEPLVFLTKISAYRTNCRKSWRGRTVGPRLMCSSVGHFDLLQW